MKSARLKGGGFNLSIEPIAKSRSAEIFVPQRGVKKEAEGVSPAKGW